MKGCHRPNAYLRVFELKTVGNTDAVLEVEVIYDVQDPDIPDIQASLRVQTQEYFLPNDAPMADMGDQASTSLSMKRRIFGER